MATITKSITTKKAFFGNSSPTWEQILGSENWEGLLEPELILELRKFILRCGNFSQATYDAFINDDMILQESSFFQDVLLQNASDYEIRSYLYAPAGILVTGTKANTRSMFKKTNWIGYVAVTTDEVSKKNGRREIYVVWRGTSNIEEWITDIVGSFDLKSADVLLATKGTDDPKVNGGWLEMYTDEPIVPGGQSVRTQLQNVINNLRKEFKKAGETAISLVVTGHSLGGALATLSAFDLVENNIIGADIPGVSAFLFSTPQVGNKDFRRRVLGHSNLKLLQSKNLWDLVPHLPDFIFTWYVPIATAELTISTCDSPYLEPISGLHNVKMDNFLGFANAIELVKSALSNLHNLEGLLHVVAWTNGLGEAFDKTPKVSRSLALVNKSSNYLKLKLKVPESWWGDLVNKKGVVFEWVPGDWANTVLFNKTT